MDWWIGLSSPLVLPSAMDVSRGGGGRLRPPDWTDQTIRCNWRKEGAAIWRALKICWALIQRGASSHSKPPAKILIQGWNLWYRKGLCFYVNEGNSQQASNVDSDLTNNKYCSLLNINSQQAPNVDSDLTHNKYCILLKIEKGRKGFVCKNFFYWLKLVLEMFNATVAKSDCHSTKIFMRTDTSVSDWGKFLLYNLKLCLEYSTILPSL